MGHLQNLACLSRALQRLLPHGAECVYEPEREYVCVGGWGRGSYHPTPPPSDCASLTGWRGRWGHRNKANTYTHISLWLLCPRISHSFPPPHFHLSVSFQDLLSPSFPRTLVLALLTSCFPLNLSLSARLLHSPTTFHLPPLSTPCPYPLLSHCIVILTCMLSLIWRGEGHMLFLAGGLQPAKLLVCVACVCVCVYPVGF